jgi:hypothetical protein
LKEYAKKNISKVKVGSDGSDGDTNAILDIINRLPDKEYDNMADVEKAVSSII